jgi:hypothetical protein
MFIFYTIFVELISSAEVLGIAASRLCLEFIKEYIFSVCFVASLDRVTTYMTAYFL